MIKLPPQQTQSVLNVYEQAVKNCREQKVRNFPPGRRVFMGNQWGLVVCDPPLPIDASYIHVELESNEIICIEWKHCEPVFGFSDLRDNIPAWLNDRIKNQMTNSTNGDLK